jgi:Predicted DNA binding protein
VELTVADGSVLTDLADYGARVRGLSASDGTGRLEIEAPPGTTARSVVDHVESFEGGELVAYHEHDVTDDAAPTTRGDFVSRLRDRLTDRQLSALQRAYLGGYFEWPREVDGDDLADTMDVSRSTFHQHLRAAERKLLAEVFADRQ